MEITINRSNEERQSPIVVIDTKTCHYPYAIRNAIQLALELDGYAKDIINEVFNQYGLDAKCEPNDLWENDAKDIYKV
jgi:hypothetical protein